MASLFGGSTTTSKPSLTINVQASNAASQPQQAGGLFGSTQPAQGGSLFGSSTSQPQQTGFGQSTQQPAQGGGPFGASTNQPQQQTGGLFGQSTQQPAQGGGLFGASTQQQPQQQQQPSLGGSLFGSTTTQQPAQQGGGLFGNTQQNAPQAGGLFGSSTQQPQQQSNSLFGGSLQQQPQQGGGLFGASNMQQQQQQQPQQQASLFGSLGASTNQSQNLGGSLWQPGNLAPRNPPCNSYAAALISNCFIGEKSIPEQIFTILEKWSPESSNCSFQHYFYNHVNPDLVPYFAPAPGEDESKWEEALAKKPSPGSIPTLARGFKAVGDRLEKSTMAVSQLQMRMHEINDSLANMMQTHELTVSVRTADARRRHMALSQRCLALATKVQVLRSRGYALDGAEEALKQKLVELEKSAFDPVLSGRQEEVWARLSDLRDRAMLLQEETDKLGKDGKADEDEALDEETMKQIRKILHDYDSQLTHLKKELDSIKSEFELWESDSRQPVRGR